MDQPSWGEPSALWPQFRSPADLSAVEAVPLEKRALPASTYAALKRAAALWPDLPAVTVLTEADNINGGTTRTFAELCFEVCRMANMLTAAGVTRTTSVGLISPNNAEFISALLASQSSGIAVPVNPSLGTDHLASLLERGCVRHLIAAGPEVDPRMWETTRAVIEAAGVTSVWVLRPTGADGTPPELDPIDGVRVAYLSSAAAQHRGESLDAIPPTAADFAAFFHTGGTTGVPKLAAHLHSNEVSNAWMLALNDAIPDDAVFFAALPLFHVNALIVTTLAPMLRGQHVVWAGPLGYREQGLYEAFWRIVERFQITVLSGVPSTYSALSSVPIDADISSLRFGMVGASPLPPTVRRTFEAHTGVPLCEGYGLTEATCATTRNFVDEPRPGSVGLRLPYLQVKAIAIEQTTGRWTDLPPHTLGILAISGPTVFPGYVIGHVEGRPVLDPLGKIVDGWLDTGDLARVDELGYVRITGRAKDVIIRGGHNIDPAVIEDALLSHPVVTAAAAVGRPHPITGEVPVAYVTTAEGANVTEDELEAWTALHIGESAAVPKSVTRWGQLPLTAIGKPNKLPLRQHATCAAVSDAFSDHAITNVAISSSLVDGSVHVILQAHDCSSVDWDAVTQALAGFPFSWEARSSSGNDNRCHAEPLISPAPAERGIPASSRDRTIID